MSDEQKDLGKLKGIFPISPALAQRAVFVAVLSFMFFMTMMFAFYLLQNIIYFVLSTAFLVLYLIMMFAWLMQKRSAVELFEKGITIKKHRLLWADIVSIEQDGEMLLISNEKLPISTSLHERDMLIAIIRSNIPRVS